jgi:hypothetical protein
MPGSQRIDAEREMQPRFRKFSMVSDAYFILSVSAKRRWGGGGAER